MKLTNQQLKQIIKEELGRVMSEVRFEDMVQASGVGGTADDPSIAGELEAERRREQERRDAGTRLQLYLMNSNTITNKRLIGWKV